VSGLRWRIGVTVALVFVWIALLYTYKIGVPFSQRLDPSQIRSERGFGYSAEVAKPALPFAFARRTDPLPTASTAELSEDGKALGPSQALLDVIMASGGGGFADRPGNMYFSASDNSDPRTNGRTYELRDRALLKKSALRRVHWIGLALLIGIWAPWLIRAWTRRSVQVKALLREPRFRGLLRRCGLFVVIASILSIATAATRGTALWLLGFAGLIVALFALRDATRILAALLGTELKVGWMTNVAVIIGTVGVWVAGFEAYLSWLESTAVSVQASAASAPKQPASVMAPEKTEDAKMPAEEVPARFRNSEFTLPPDLREEMKRRNDLLSLPQEWENKQIELAGAKWAYSWHGINHIHDDNNFRRRIGPFPEKRADTMRVLVVGDSMTYGAGIREEWTYTAQLERAMQKRYRVEFLNLGLNGAQSEDILKVIERMVPPLKPDLVIYGVCYNDFLPSGIGQYQKEYKVPLPQWLKDFLTERTRFAGFLSDNYASMLLWLGLSMDFYDDILKDFNGYQRRFAEDVRRMNAFVRSQGLPPIVGMALDQNVQVGGRGHRISQTAERLMKEAGFDVILLDPYYEAFNGKRFIVSRWEGHPDEEANAIFAAMLYDHLTRDPHIQRYAKSARAAATTN
jgi:lysophospholipase L1-like esterase